MDDAILLVLPSGAYQYRFIVDGEWRHAHDVPYLSDETGLVNNIVDVHVCISLLFHFFSHTLSLSLSLLFYPKTLPFVHERGLSILISSSPMLLF